MYKRIIATVLIVIPLTTLAFELSPCTTGNALQYNSATGFTCGNPGLVMANTTVNDINYTAAATDQVIGYTALTAPRTVTFTPVGSATNLKFWQVKDMSGSASLAHPINLASTFGTFDGLSTTAITEAGGSKNFYDDGTRFLMGSAFLPASGTVNALQKADGNGGFMPAAAGTDYALPTVRSQSAVSHSIVTGTGATGFQVSSTRDAEVSYGVTIVTSATLVSSAAGTLVLEIAATNSATPSDWVEVGRMTNGQVFSLAVAIGCTQTIAGQLVGYVPAGYYAKIRSVTGSGTPTYTYNSGQERLL